MPSVVVLDLGEVLATPAILFEDLGVVLGVAPGELGAPYWAHRVPYDAGLSPAQYWALVAADLGLDLDGQAVERVAQRDAALWTQLRPDAEGLLRRLGEARVRTALLSSAPASLAAAARERPWVRAFDRLFFSGEMGVVGAIEARAGTPGLIPGSMGTASYVVVSKGNADALHSSPQVPGGRTRARGRAGRSPASSCARRCAGSSTATPTRSSTRSPRRTRTSTR